MKEINIECELERSFRRADNAAIGRIDRFTPQETLWAILRGERGFGFGIWFAARRELIRRGLLENSNTEGEEGVRWAS